MLLFCDHIVLPLMYWDTTAKVFCSVWFVVIYSSWSLHLETVGLFLVLLHVNLVKFLPPLLSVILTSCHRFWSWGQQGPLSLHICLGMRRPTQAISLCTASLVFNRWIYIVVAMPPLHLKAQQMVNMSCTGLKKAVLSHIVDTAWCVHFI